MNAPQIRFEVARYKAVKAQLLAEFADLDAQTLADTAEGLTDFADVLAADVRAALEDETMVALLKIRMSEMSDRLDRFQSRAERRRQIVRDAMIEADVPKILKEDFTISLRSGSPHVVVIDEKLIPQTFFEMRPHLRKRDLLEALKDGVQIDGAVLSNPGLSLTVRTR